MNSLKMGKQYTEISHDEVPVLAVLTSHQERTAEWSQLLRLSCSNQDESVEFADCILLRNEIYSHL